MRYHALQRHDIIKGFAGVEGNILTNIFTRISSINQYHWAKGNTEGQHGEIN
jgi:hypothetical protein